MACWKARSRPPISANSTFHQLSRLRRYEWMLVEIVVFERVGGVRSFVRAEVQPTLVDPSDGSNAPAQGNKGN